MGVTWRVNISVKKVRSVWGSHLNSKAKEFAYLAQEMGEKSNSSAHCCGMKKDAGGGGLWIRLLISLQLDCSIYMVKRISVYSWMVGDPASTELNCWYISDNTQSAVYSSSMIILLQVLYWTINYYYRSQFYSITAGGCRVKYPSFSLIDCLHMPVCEYKRRTVESFFFPRRND